jgi:deoxyribodipyrimidine photo-lyase
LQTAGKTYLARADNIAHYTDGVHAPEAGQLASTALTLREEPLPKVAPWTEDAASVASLTNHDRIGLWLHPEDLVAEQGELAGLKIKAINASWPASIAARAGWSDKVSSWTQAALHDGATRAGQHFRAEVSAGETTDLAATLADWAQANQLQAVVAYRPFIGPWLPEALAVEARLAATGIKMIWRRRAWDTQYFPHAIRGYFPFWEKIKSAC